MIFKSENSEDSHMPSKGYLRLWAAKLAKESVANFKKELLNE